jgi:hypothetical protein
VGSARATITPTCNQDIAERRQFGHFIFHSLNIVPQCSQDQVIRRPRCETRTPTQTDFSPRLMRTPNIGCRLNVGLLMRASRVSSAKVAFDKTDGTRRRAPAQVLMSRVRFKESSNYGKSIPQILDNDPTFRVPQSRWRINTSKLKLSGRDCV